MSRIDSFHAEVMADYYHHKSHVGQLWAASDYQATFTGPGVYSLVTGALMLHCKFRLALALGGNMFLTEGVTGLTGGVNVPFSNYNRNWPLNKFLSVLTRAPTGATGGTALPPDYVPVDGKGNPQMSINVGAEYVLKLNTSYLLTITALASGNLQLDVEGYEENLS